MRFRQLARTLGFVSLLAVVTACSGVELPPPDTSAPRAEPPQREGGTTVVSWGANWEVRIRPVFSGMALEQGTGTVVIERWQDGPLAVRYSFPAVSLGTVPQHVRDAGTGIIRPKPVEGRISLPDRAREEGVFTPPAFWPGGEAASPGALIWFPRSVLEELQTARRATIRLAPLPNGLAMTGEPAKGADAVTLAVRATRNVVIQVNGKPIRVPALALEDDRGATYSLLNTPDNPLVVEFRFGRETIVAGKKLTAAPGGGYEVVGLRFLGDDATSPTRP